MSDTDIQQLHMAVGFTQIKSMLLQQLKKIPSSHSNWEMKDKSKKNLLVQTTCKGNVGIR